MKRSEFYSPRIASTPLEDHYQKQFYSALQVDGLFLSPEFSTTGVKGLGSIDFYLAPNKWGFEFTKDGRQISDHYNRFLRNGRYHRWIAEGTFSDWVLLDFRTTKPTNVYPGKKPKYTLVDAWLIGISDFDHLYHIVFCDNYTLVEVYNHLLVPVDKFPLLE